MTENSVLSRSGEGSAYLLAQGISERSEEQQSDILQCIPLNLTTCCLALIIEIKQSNLYTDYLRQVNQLSSLNFQQGELWSQQQDLQDRVRRGGNILDDIGNDLDEMDGFGCDPNSYQNAQKEFRRVGAKREAYQQKEERVGAAFFELNFNKNDICLQMQSNIKKLLHFEDKKMCQPLKRAKQLLDKLQAKGIELKQQEVYDKFKELKNAQESLRSTIYPGHYEDIPSSGELGKLIRLVYSKDFESSCTVM